MAHISNVSPLAVRLPCNPGPYQDASPVWPSEAEHACALSVRTKQNAIAMIIIGIKYRRTLPYWAAG
jgi:hypothetical protein